MSKTWDFTWWNFEEKDVDFLRSWESDVSKMVVGIEVAPTTGKEHLQGRVTFRRGYRFTGVKKLTNNNDNVHWEKTKCIQDSLYCRKEGRVVIDIDNRKQGQRSDLIEIKNAIDNGMKYHELWDNYYSIMIKYRGGIKEYFNLKNRREVKSKYSLDSCVANLGVTEVTDWSKSVILAGSPGIGKTEFALAHFDNALLVSHIDDLVNFDPEIYDGIVFDDMDFSHYPRTAQIHLVDIDHPRSINVRYTTALIPANTKKIFTTNKPEGDVVDLSDQAIFRRVSICDCDRSGAR